MKETYNNTLLNNLSSLYSLLLLKAPAHDRHEGPCQGLKHSDPYHDRLRSSPSQCIYYHWIQWFLGTVQDNPLLLDTVPGYGRNEVQWEWLLMIERQKEKESESFQGRENWTVKERQ